MACACTLDQESGNVAQFTKKAIIKTFMELLNEEPFDKITVTDIVNRCDINRNTFYYYFTDMYALVDEIFRAETLPIIEAHRTYDTWQEGFLEVTDFALSNKTAIYHLYNSINRERLETYLYEVTLSFMDEYVRAQAEGLRVSEDDIHTLSSLYTAALEGIVLEWLHAGMKQDPVSYIDNIGRLLGGSTRFALERAAKTPHA